MTDLTPPKALIFDWDDTITHNWWRVVQSINKTLSALGRAEWTEEEALGRIGPSGRDLFLDLFGEDGVEEAETLYNGFIRELHQETPNVLPGAVESIRALSDLPLYLGVLSNKRGHALQDEVAKLDLHGCFGQVVGAGDALADKPNRLALEKALTGSGLEPGPDIWFVGDSYIDMQCAHNSDCTAILIETKLPPAHLLEETPPHMRFASCADLTSHVFKHFFNDFDLPLLRTQCTS